MKRQFLTGKNVLIMGLGRFGGGVDAAKFALNSGAKVTITDSAPADKLTDSIKQLEQFKEIGFRLGSHDFADFENADIIIPNPAVAPDNEFLEFAREKNKTIMPAINIFFELCPAMTIGITGANGKSTTAALTAHLLKTAGRENIFLSGNIGNEPLLQLLDKLSENDLVVLELSSFQLEQLVQIEKAPQIALLTNLTPNHLDRHKTFENYCAAKENIFKFQKLDENSPAVSVFNAQDKIACQWFDKYDKDTGRTCLKFSPDDISQELRQQFPLPGRANLANLAAAVKIAKHLGVDDNSIETALPDFKPLPHRLELLAEINGVSWYNDSIATTPQSTIAALEAFEKPVILIAGGYDKNLPFDQLGKIIAQNAKAAILIGDTAQKISDSITAAAGNKTTVQFASSLEEAVDLANKMTAKGDVVLLSPACASYDMFDNFQHRGNEFIRLVKQLEN
ncbi:MAG: UDP-N-acetylmuramoyl-L-alanine--D-glutamate ligase [Sedimentisphaerales bacterium]|nr:UDP-N-acetylmuramoyl-L-alanine--D-glutamate ligase [Sedimentisphaerales bacterium]